MMPGRRFSGARTPRLAFLLTLLGLSGGCMTPKPDLAKAAAATPKYALPKPSNVDNTAREMPPKPADAPAPVSIRKPAAPDQGATMTGPGVNLPSARSLDGSMTTGGMTPPLKVPPNQATMALTPANATYGPARPGAPATLAPTGDAVPVSPPPPAERGTNSNIVVPTLATGTPPAAEPPPPIVPPPMVLGVPPSLPGKN